MRAHDPKGAGGGLRLLVVEPFVDDARREVVALKHVPRDRAEELDRAPGSVPAVVVEAVRDEVPEEPEAASLRHGREPELRVRHVLQVLAVQQVLHLERQRSEYGGRYSHGSEVLDPVRP